MVYSINIYFFQLRLQG